MPILPDYRDRVIYELWKLLDDIDTISDMAKFDNALYRKLTTKKANKRWEVLSDSQVEELYRRFHPLYLPVEEVEGSEHEVGN